MADDVLDGFGWGVVKRKTKFTEQDNERETERRRRMGLQLRIRKHWQELSTRHRPAKWKEHVSITWYLVHDFGDDGHWQIMRALFFLKKSGYLLKNYQRPHVPSVLFIYLFISSNSWSKQKQEQCCLQVFANAAHQLVFVLVPAACRPPARHEATNLDDGISTWLQRL